MRNCVCGGPLIAVRIGITEKGILKGTMCWKTWCPYCENSATDGEGNIDYYQMLGGGRFTSDPLDFWVPESVKFQYKLKFVKSVLKLANKNKFKGTQFYEMEDIRKVYREDYK